MFCYRNSLYISTYMISAYAISDYLSCLSKQDHIIIELLLPYSTCRGMLIENTIHMVRNNLLQDIRIVQELEAS